MSKLPEDTKQVLREEFGTYLDGIAGQSVRVLAADIEHISIIRTSLSRKIADIASRVDATDSITELTTLREVARMGNEMDLCLSRAALLFGDMLVIIGEEDTRA